LLFTILVRKGVARRHAFRIGVALAIGWGLGFALFRPYAALLSLVAFWFIALIAAFDALFPAATSIVQETVSRAGATAMEGVKIWASRWTGVLVLLGVFGVTASYLARPSLDLDLGSGRETTLAHQFAGFDREGEVSFRRALRRAYVDLRDLGGGSQWRITVTASLPEGPRSLVLVRAASKELDVELGPSWSTHAFEAEAPLGWRSGLRIDLPSASEALDLRIDRIRIERGRSFPSLRILLGIVGAALLFMAIGRASGLSSRTSGLLAVLPLASGIAAPTIEPLLVVPFVPVFLGVTTAGFFFICLVSGILAVMVPRGLVPSLPPAALAAAGIGFVAWLAAALFPLYQGGHFVFHSSIAQEIWQGEFMKYYLPYPGSMLSRQPHWGNVIVPHSCLYHTLVSPLATLPRYWFYTIETCVLAVMLSMIALAASLLATRLGSERAGALSAIAAIGLPTTFQLLGLGHLMTLFGCWASTLALSFVVLRFDDLQTRSTWWWSVLFLTLAFLSYTASVLFGAVVLALAILILYRWDPSRARALAGATLASLAAAFLLYYVHWTLPFLRESLPALLGSKGGDPGEPAFVLGSRIAAIPRKLTYTYGSPLVPLVGLAGLGLVGRPKQRVVLAAWAGILILFSGLDLFFNFILKHHYFVMAPVSVGVGLATAWAWDKGRVGRGLAVFFLVYILGLGAREALRVAMGQV
jgi:hypothetical protein